jgi:hypothetical protein
MIYDVGTRSTAAQAATSTAATTVPDPGDVWAAGRRDGESLPLTMLDESLLLLQETRASWNVQFELGTDHHLDEARLRQAVLSCCQRHPLARARLTRSPQGETSYRWDFADEVDLDPLRVVECPDSAALDRLRTELYSPPIAVDTTPGFRLVLARRPSGDLILLSASHLVADGVGALRLMQTIHRAYRDEPDPPDPLSLAKARALGAFWPRRPAARSGRGGWKGYGEFARRSIRRVGSRSLAAPTATVSDSSFVPSTSARPPRQGS